MTTLNSYMVGIDVGGTFTDGVAVDEKGTIYTAKASSTTADPAIGVMNVLSKLANKVGIPLAQFVSNVPRFVYGTTVATNTLLQRKGLDIVLITTRGFRDQLNVRRIWREDGYDLRALPPEPFVPRHRTYEVTERIDHKGNIITPLVEADVISIAEQIKKAGIDSVAVCLLFSILNPAHERKVKELLLREIPDLRVSISSDVCPEIREYERASTVSINAYLAHTVEKQLENFEENLYQMGLEAKLQIMQSSGGVTTTQFIADRPVNIFLSGPAGGVVATSYLGRLVKAEDNNNFLAVDMGGTSFDISLLPEGHIPLSTNSVVHGWHIIAPTINIQTIGAGGGSIAWVDIGGGLHVGPHSAGAIPGPACYMKGGEDATVTDADLVLGYIDPDYFLGGEIKLSLEKAEEAIGKLADKIGLSVIETAAGIFSIVNENMLGGMRLVTLERGRDPRDYSLFVFGGAAPLHVPYFASELEIKHIIIPRDASVFSALGLVVSEIRFDFVKNINRNSRDISFEELMGEYADLQKQGTDCLEKSLVVPKDRYFVLRADMKFPGEFTEFLVDIPSKIKSVKDVQQAFIDYHQKLYEYAEEISPDILNIRLSAFGKTHKPRIAKTKLSGENSKGAIKSKRKAYFHKLGKSILTDVYDGHKIVPGNRLSGPAIIELPTTTIVVRPDQTCFMDEFCNFNIES